MDPYSVPWPIALAVATALSTTIGVLWKRLIDKDDEHQRRYLGIIDRYHAIVVLVHQAIELKDEPPLSGGTP
jgi:hypothetical protein